MFDIFKQGDKFHFNLKGSCIALPLILSTPIDHKGTEIKMFNTIHSTTAVEIKTSSSVYKFWTLQASARKDLLKPIELVYSLIKGFVCFDQNVHLKVVNGRPYFLNTSNMTFKEQAIIYI